MRTFSKAHFNGQLLAIPLDTHPLAQRQIVEGEASTGLK
jgi:hypothetical protein